MKNGDIEPDVLEELYVDEDMTRQEVADELEKEVHQINYLLRKHKIYKTVYGMTQAIGRKTDFDDDEYGF